MTMDDDERYTQSGDPSSAIFDDSKASIRPDFIGAKEASADSLRNAEENFAIQSSGAKSANSSGGNISSAKKAEESSNNPNGFANKVTGQNGPTKTTKGKGISYMEDKAGWHGKAPNDEEYQIAMKDLDNISAQLEGGAN